ncbi:Uncharacterised protein [uncultured archaeon]|nr:Uncharacterised protein [uncultured archaeon]
MHMEKTSKREPKGNRTMFHIGIALVIFAAAMMLGNFMSDSAFPIVLGILGVVSIGASRFRLLK